MTLLQLQRTLSEVVYKHAFPNQGAGIKYVDFSFDNRTETVFAIKFRNCKGGEKVFSKTNENRDIDLYETVMNWLKDNESNI